MKAKNLIKTIAFLAIIALIFTGMQRLFGVSDRRAIQSYTSYKAETGHELDAIYIGSSNVYSFVQAPIAWENYGYTIFPLSIPGMPCQATVYMLDYARRTHPDSLYIININSFKDTSVDLSNLHFL